VRNANDCGNSFSQLYDYEWLYSIKMNTPSRHVSSEKSSKILEKVGQENGKDILRDTKTGLTWYPAVG